MSAGTRRGSERASWAASFVLVVLLACGLSACASDRERALERLEVEEVPRAERVTVGEFRDLTLSEQADVLLRFYEVDRIEECPNLDYAGGVANSSVFQRVRTDSLNEPASRPMSEVLIKYCAGADRPIGE